MMIFNISLRTLFVISLYLVSINIWSMEPENKPFIDHLYERHGIHTFEDQLITPSIELFGEIPQEEKKLFLIETTPLSPLSLSNNAKPLLSIAANACAKYLLESSENIENILANIPDHLQSLIGQELRRNPECKKFIKSIARGLKKASLEENKTRKQEIKNTLAHFEQKTPSQLIAFINEASHQDRAQISQCFDIYETPGKNEPKRRHLSGRPSCMKKLFD